MAILIGKKLYVIQKANTIIQILSYKELFSSLERDLANVSFFFFNFASSSRTKNPIIMLD